MAIKAYSRSKDGSKKLSANLTVGEFAVYGNARLAAQYCGDGVKIDTALVAILQKIRDHFKKPLVITSAYRPAGYNAGIGGSKNSYHIYGRAADFYVKGVRAADVAKYAESIGAKGIGLYTAQSFVHIDTRSSKYFWRNDGKGNVTVSTHGGQTNPCSDWTTYVKAVQSAIGAAADGIVGSRTLAACPTIKQGSKHGVVKPVQNRLNYIGHDCGTADGVFGAKTTAGVKAFQKANGLTVDGVIGQNTWRKLLGV